jgi:hypothetical protein
MPRAGQTPSQDTTATDIAITIARAATAWVKGFLVVLFRLYPRPMPDLLCHAHRQDPDSGLWMMCHLPGSHTDDHYDLAYDKFWSQADLATTTEVHH